MIRSYKEYRPSAKLNDYVKCYWMLSKAESMSWQKIRFVPDGNPEWIFVTGARPEFYFSSGLRQRSHEAISLGQFSGHLDLHFPTEQTTLFGIKFQPYGAYHIWDQDMDLFSNRVHDLSHLRATLCDQIRAVLDTDHSMEKKTRRLDPLIKKAIQGRPDKNLVFAIEKMKSQDPGTTLYGIQQSLGISDRRLEQLFKSEIGLSPKAYFKIQRIRKAVSTLQNNPERSLTELANMFDYYDQSHFIREIKQSTGYTPVAIKKQEGGVIQLLHG